MTTTTALVPTNNAIAGRPDHTLAGNPALVRAADGFPITARIFEPSGPALATVVIQGATATPQRYYRGFARACRVAGYRVVTYDYRGIGESTGAEKGARGMTMSDWALQDTAAIHRMVAEVYDEPTIIVGHSFGGQALGLVDPPPRLAAVFLVASQLGYVGHWPVLRGLGLRLLWRGVVPVLTAITGRMPGWAGLGGVDLPAGVARQWARWCLHPDYLMSEHPDAWARFERWSVPILSVSFSDDPIAPRGAVRALGALLDNGEPSAPNLVRREVTPADYGLRKVGHFGFFRSAGASLWSQALQFFDDMLNGVQIAPEPNSHAPLTMDEIIGDLEYGRGARSPA
jgi:predicted alpha/beta hydrolase